MTEPAPEIGWKILDPDGNVVDSGPVSIAHLTADTVEALKEFVANINTEG